ENGLSEAGGALEVGRLHGSECLRHAEPSAQFRRAAELAVIPRDVAVIPRLPNKLSRIARGGLLHFEKCFQFVAHIVVPPANGTRFPPLDFRRLHLFVPRIEQMCGETLSFSKLAPACNLKYLNALGIKICGVIVTA